MKRFFHLQLLLLCIGIISWIATIFIQKEAFYVTFPIPAFLQKLGIPLQASQVVLTNRNLILMDVTYTRKTLRFSAPCVRFSFLSAWNPFKGWQCSFQQGSLQNSFGKFTSLTGQLQKNRKGYRGFLSAQSDAYGSLQIHLDDFIPTKIFEKLPIFSTEKTHLFSFKNLQAHARYSNKNVNVILHSFEGSYQDITAKGLKIHFGLGRNAPVSLQFEQAKATNFCIKNGFLKALYSFQESNITFQNLHLQGTAEADVGKISFYGFSPKFSLQQPSLAWLTFYNQSLSGTGKIQVACKEREGKILSGQFFANKFLPTEIKKIASFFPKLPTSPYSLTLYPPIYANAWRDEIYRSASIFAPHLQIEQTDFQNATVTLHLDEPKQELQWEAKISNANNDLQSQGSYQISQQKGQVFCSGRIEPALLMPLQPWLPDWWQDFSNSFHFFEKNPYANVEIQWDASRAWNSVFGYVKGKHFRYQQIDAKKVDVTFHHQPGFCWIKIQQLETADGKGGCCVHWPYDPKDESHEQWQFSGAGTFPVQQWDTILHSFLKNIDTQQLKLFSPLSMAKADFHGCFSAPENPQDGFTVHLQSPAIKIDTFPFKDFETFYDWDAKQIRLRNFRGLLFHTAPIQAQICWEGKNFVGQMQGENVPTQELLRQPLFASWASEVPSDNLETYNGLLNANIQAHGQWKPTLSVQGTGSVDFRNPNLAQIHLLGPLQTTLLKKFKLLPTIQLDRFTSDFSFDEQNIQAQKAEISGKTTRVEITDGKVNLKTQQLSGDLHFSFLDSHQTKLPVVKQILQIFSPITRGFSTNCTGSFHSPKYFITFNPFRWMLPTHHHRKQKK